MGSPRPRAAGRARAVLRLPLALCLCLAFLAASVANAAACAGSHVVPNGGNLALMRRATLCLLNQQRRHHGLHPLRANRALEAAARYHARDMISRGYFAHTSPSGDTIASRIRHAGYMSPRLHWTVGENLGWGTGLASTPAGMMTGWMHSPEHRSNILYPGFRQAGIVVDLGLPMRGSGGAQGATFANEFGVRR